MDGFAWFGGRWREWIGGTRKKAYASGECKFEVVGAEGVVFNGSIDNFGEERGVAEKVLGYAEPEAKELCSWVSRRCWLVGRECI